MKTFKHQYKDDTFAWIEYTYASIYEVYVELVKEKMIENEIKPIDVVVLDVVLWGDHGLKAFCLGFCAIVTVNMEEQPLSQGKMPLSFRFCSKRTQRKVIQQLSLLE